MKRGQTDYSFVVAVNKPIGISSHATLNVLKKTLGEKRIGHAGTLDPNASGVLVALVGSATRLNQYIVSDDKTYVGDILFGTTTDTDDSEGHVIQRITCPDILMDPNYTRCVLSNFIGTFEQIPPNYSAIKKNGVKAYELARKGSDVNLASRSVTVYRADLQEIFETFNEGQSAVIWRIKFCVSKGTYIRSLARDIGSFAGCGAHLSNLIRTKSGCISLDRCIQYDSNIPSITNNIINPVELLNLPSIKLKKTSVSKLNNGDFFYIDDIDSFCDDQSSLIVDSQKIAVLNDKGLKAIYSYCNSFNSYKPVCVFQKEISCDSY